LLHRQWLETLIGLVARDLIVTGLITAAAALSYGELAE
jgi:hypothetical protein